MSTTAEITTACVEYSNVFLHPLLDEGKTSATERSGHRREQAMLQRQAANLCAQCPLQASCLTDAVTKFDVSGFVAGTTRRQRQEIRRRLGFELAEDDFDQWAGVPSQRTYDADEIVRLRQANPNEPLKFIAARIGCSISTVKRHLRKMTEQQQETRTAAPKRRIPTRNEVMAVAAEVVETITDARAA